MIKKDVIGNIPKIGNIVVYNPAYYKGIELLLITEFSKVGCPVGFHLEKNLNKSGYLHTIKTTFYITNLEYGK